MIQKNEKASNKTIHMYTYTYICMYITKFLQLTQRNRWHQPMKSNHPGTHHKTHVFVGFASGPDQHCKNQESTGNSLHPPLCWSSGICHRHMFDNLRLRPRTLFQWRKCRKRWHLSRWRTFLPRTADRTRRHLVRPAPKTFLPYTFGRLVDRLYLCIGRPGICRCCLPRGTASL